MNRRLGLIVSICLILTGAFALASCGDNGGLRDGYYSATYDDFDAYGWKEYVTIFVSGGRVSSVEYNAQNRGGFLKTWDMEYMRDMSAEVETYPNAYTRDYAAQLLAWQSPAEVDAISGATESHEKFVLLAQAVIDRARAGDPAVAILSASRDATQ